MAPFTLQWGIMATGGIAESKCPPSPDYLDATLDATLC